MYLIIIAWLYVTLMMAVAEATNSNGSVLGAVITFVLYGLLPTGLIAYLLRSPARRAANRQREQEAQAAQRAAEVAAFAAVTPSVEAPATLPAASTGNADVRPVVDPDGGGETPGGAVSNGIAPVRKKP